ncbi:hypothetical protein GCM10020254_58370 [Streptomyces goshikiensis]
MTLPDTVGLAGRETAPPPARPPVRKRRGAALLTAALAGVLLVVALLSAGVGAYEIPTGDVLASVQHRTGLGGAALDRVGESVLWNVRLPRVVLALLVGSSLGCAGALMQGVFGNPLAEPGVIGISAGAAVGAVASIGLGLSFFGNWTITACAFVSGLVTVGSVYLLSRSGGKTEVVTLILTGIAVNAFAGALIGLFVFFADSGQVNQITFWQLGSLAQATWPKVLAVLPCALTGLLIAPFHAGKLDLLALGERPARHLGIEVERLRLTLILVVALLTAAAVAVAGVITFVGLLVPHLLRMANGPGHRFLVPGSALAGAVVLLAGDLAARTIAAPAELPLGVLTALIGSPFFFWLLRRTRRKQGGLGMSLLFRRRGRSAPARPAPGAPPRRGLGPPRPARAARGAGRDRADGPGRRGAGPGRAERRGQVHPAGRPRRGPPGGLRSRTDRRAPGGRLVGARARAAPLGAPTVGGAGVPLSRGGRRPDGPRPLGGYPLRRIRRGGGRRRHGRDRGDRLRRAPLLRALRRRAGPGRAGPRPGPGGAAAAARRTHGRPRPAPPRSWCCGSAGSGPPPGTRWSSSCTTWAWPPRTRTGPPCCTTGGSRRTGRRPRCSMTGC